MSFKFHSIFREILFKYTEERVLYMLKDTKECTDNKTYQHYQLRRQHAAFWLFALSSQMIRQLKLSVLKSSGRSSKYSCFDVHRIIFYSENLASCFLEFWKRCVSTQVAQLVKGGHATHSVIGSRYEISFSESLQSSINQLFSFELRLRMLSL